MAGNAPAARRAAKPADKATDTTDNATPPADAADKATPPPAPEVTPDHDRAREVLAEMITAVEGHTKNNKIGLAYGIEGGRMTIADAAAYLADGGVMYDTTIKDTAEAYTLAPQGITPARDGDAWILTALDGSKWTTHAARGCALLGVPADHLFATWRPTLPELKSLAGKPDVFSAAADVATEKARKAAEKAKAERDAAIKRDVEAVATLVGYGQTPTGMLAEMVAKWGREDIAAALKAKGLAVELPAAAK